MNEISPFEPPRFCRLKPCGGRIGPDEEHFVVEEIPAYPLSGSGEHVFFWIEKRGQNTQEVARRLARAGGIKERDVGYAGMKDKNAITRQWFSIVHKVDDADTWNLGEDISILSVMRHNNKLRTGHLIGNRFTITLVDVPEERFQEASSIAEVLREKGLPNYFGTQRFGHAGRNLSQALAWISRGADEAPTGRDEKRKSRKKGGGRFENKLLPSVLQSEIFNRYLGARLGQREELLLGEVVRLRGSGKHFVIEDVARELPRYRERDLFLTGPMIGPKGLQARDEARTLEESICSELGLDGAALARLARHAPGTRRDLMLEPEQLEANRSGEGKLVLTFTLPAGAYATQVVREFTGIGEGAIRASATLPAVT